MIDEHVSNKLPVNRKNRRTIFINTCAKIHQYTKIKRSVKKETVKINQTITTEN